MSKYDYGVFIIRLSLTQTSTMREHKQRAAAAFSACRPIFPQGQPLSRIRRQLAPLSSFPIIRKSQLSSLPEQNSFLFLADDTSAFGDNVARAYASDANPVTFEPVVDVPALLVTVFVLVGALLLRLRQSAIANAAATRADALTGLRTIKTKELNNSASPEEVRRAVQAYQASLDAEERLRTLLPGIRLRAPNNPQKSPEDQQAMRQFLGLNTTALVDESNAQDPTKQIALDEDGIVATRELLGLGALLFLLLSPQILTIFLDESNTKEVFNILS